MHKHSNSIISGITQDPEICSESEVSLSDRTNGEQDLPISEQLPVLPEVEVTQERQRTATPPPRVVDGTIIESTLLGADESEQSNPPRVQRRHRLLHVALSCATWVVPLLALMALLFTETFPDLPGFLTQFIPGLLPSATVTIVPASLNLHITSTIAAVTGTPNISHHEVRARLISVTTRPQEAAIPTTGKGHIPALRATGSVTFYNQLTISQTIASGTVLTGVDGVQVVTEQVAFIPAALPPVEGQVTVPARALQAGPKGNITVHDINTLCCVEGVAVQNLVAFTGGEQAHEYPAVSQQDFNGVSEPLTTALTHHAQTTFYAQMLPNEKEVTPPQCTSTVQPDHPVGSEATWVSVVVAVTCRGEVYDMQAAKALGIALLTEQAEKGLGPSYSCLGHIAASITQVRPISAHHSTLSLIVKAEGIWSYRFSSTRLHTFARLVAGKGVKEAKVLLQKMQGVHAVTIVISRGGSAVLPSNPDQITVQLLIVIGL